MLARRKRLEPNVRIDVEIPVTRRARLQSRSVTGVPISRFKSYEWVNISSLSASRCPALVAAEAPITVMIIMNCYSSGSYLLYSSVRVGEQWALKPFLTAV